MGSLFGSVLVHLLPRGVGRAITNRRCPKVYIPNAGFDPEMHGYTVAECAGLIVDMVRRDTGTDTPVCDIVQFVLVDTTNCEYCVPIDKVRIAELGIVLIDVPLIDNDDVTTAAMINEGEFRGSAKRTYLSPQKLVEVLVSLGS